MKKIFITSILVSIIIYSCNNPTNQKSGEESFSLFLECFNETALPINTKIESIENEMIPTEYKSFFNQ